MAEKLEWDSPYFNRTEWLFDHLSSLNIEKDEALLLLVINYLNEKGELVLEDTLMEMTHLNPEQLDEAIELLSAKGYLVIEPKNHRIEWQLQGLLGSEPSLMTVPDSLLNEFQGTFGRPLSGSEMERILQLSSSYEESMIIHALDEAAVYEKLSLGYVENVLTAWKARGLSADDIERGKR